LTVCAVVGVVVLVGCLTGAAGAAGGCTSPAGAAACAGSASAPFVTPSQAKAAMAALWNAREKADATKNVKVLDGVDTGSMLLEGHYALDSVICGCSKWYWTKGVRHMQDVAVFMPRQTHYPLFFFARVLASSGNATLRAGDATAYMIVTRAAPGSPWKLAMQLFDQGYDPPVGGISPIALDTAGYDESPLDSDLRAATKWPAMLATYYRHIKVDGAPPAHSVFLAGPMTTRTDLANNLDGSVSGGIIHHYTFVASPLGGPWVFQGEGALMACADINEYATITWARPHTVFQQIDGTKGNWGADLNSGFYSKILTTWERAVCILKTPTGLYVWGTNDASGYPIHTGGVPAPAGPGTTRIL
jgi:hypothetical protein